MEQQASNRSLRVFITICIGQFVSILGTGLTNFAVGIWVYQKSGSVTKFSLTLLAIMVPSILISPFAGALVDRWDRRSTMIVGDLVAGLASLVIAVLLYWGRLQVWQVCAIVAVKAVAGMFHRLAYTASVTLLVPKEQFSRAIGLMQIGPAAAKVVSPLLAGLLLAWIPIHQVVMIDFASFLVAVTVLLGVQFPRPAASGKSESAEAPLLSQASFGWAYVKTRPGLVWLLVLFTVHNFAMAMADVVLVPMLLGVTSIGVVGQIASVAGLGMLGGSIVLSIWGGPIRRVHGVLSFTVLFGACLILAGLYQSVLLISIAAFGFIFAMPIIEGCNQAIWLSKTPADLLGRVSSVRNMIGLSASLFGCLVAGPLADKVFEPLLIANGPLATSVGRVMGVGTGRGLGLLLVALGVFTLLSVGIGYLNPRLRHVEDELPDAVPEAAAAEGNPDEAVAVRTATAV
jgi:DHA3 family macrolide efflux protein-like MFS transporter